MTRERRPRGRVVRTTLVLLTMAALMLLVLLAATLSLLLIKTRGLKKTAERIAPPNDTTVRERDTGSDQAGVSQPKRDGSNSPATPQGASTEEPDLATVSGADVTRPAAPGELPPTAVRIERSHQPGTERPPSLFDLKPLEIVNVQLTDRALRRPFKLAGRWHQQGLWAQPGPGDGTSQISFLLKGESARLRGTAGISDADPNGPVAEGGEQPAVVFRIYGDGNLLWESAALHGHGAQQEFDVDLRAVTLLALVAESGDPAKSPGCVWGGLELAGKNR